MEIKRATTNLTVDSTLKLPKSELKRKFLHVFNRGIKGDPYVFMNRLWVTALFPQLAAEPKFGSDKKGIQNALKMQDPAGIAGMIYLVKDLTEQQFRVSIPVYHRSYLGASTELTSVLMRTFLAGISVTVDAVPDDELDQNMGQAVPLNRFYPAGRMLTAASWMDITTKTELAETFKGIRIESKGHEIRIFAEFVISKAEAQQLSSTPWLQIRTIDLYPLMLHWVINAYGQRGRALTSSFPVSTIARTLPKEHNKPENVRVDDYGLSVTPDGTPAYLPRECDNTQKYEDLYMQAGVNDDNSFSLMDYRKDARRLPANVPVLMDWQNLRFAYSNTNGVLATLDLGRYQRCKPTHAVAILGREVVELDKLVQQMASLAVLAKVPLTLTAWMKATDSEATGVPLDNYRSAEIGNSYARELEVIYRRTTGEETVLLSDLTEANPVFAPLARFFAAVYEGSVANLDAIYEKYSVSYVTHTLGLLGVLVKYGSRLTEMKLEDTAARKAALNQGVTEGWEPPAIPLLADKIGLLPHQKKVRNLLKDSPDLAILPVQAGGGKSPLAIIDVLYEIKAGTNAPYLILCPGHLVAQYVKEIVFFTGGKLNAVPINTYVIRTSGFARVGKILESAPRNTVVICDYDALRYRAADTIYGTSPATVFPVIEFLRQFGFGYCLLDESHSVKNNSARTRAAMNLIADIPKKRLASGTMAHDSPSDLVMQIAMMDPTLFGTRDDFNSVYAEEVKGDRVVKWRPGAASQIMAKIRTRVVVAGAMRKEWASLLPQPVEKFLRCDLSPAQLSVYQSILQETLEVIKEAAKTNKGLAEALSPTKKETASGDDEAEAENLEALLKPYLARLEQFLTAPGRDPLGEKLLTGDDRVSPKVRIIAERIRNHIASGADGKVLIFTNYTAGAEEIFTNMPADLQPMGLHYTAAEKVEKGAEFENSDRKKWMVGVEFSMNTGLNLQFVSRLIRVDTVWNPGTLEQGNSRINRPELKKEDRRDAIFYDWIVANGTIDCTKIARLISKVVSIAKFENSEDGNYQGLPDVEVIGMTLENILTLNSWDTNLLEYFNAFKDYKTVQAADYAEYRQKHGTLKLDPIDVAPTPQGAALLNKVPYVPGLEVFGQGQFGLIRVDEYLRLEPDDEAEGDEVEEPEDVGDSSDPLVIEAIGRVVHTEYGDGVITRISKNRRWVHFKMANGIATRVKSAAAFLTPEGHNLQDDVRTAMLEAIDPEMPVAAVEEVAAIGFKQARLTRREQLELERQRKISERDARKSKKKQREATMSVELAFSVSNGYLSLTYIMADEDAATTPVAQALQALGFRQNRPFVYAEVANAQRLAKQFNVWEEAGFTLDKKTGVDSSAAFRSLYELLKSGGVAKNRLVYKFSQAAQLSNFYRTEFKPSSDPAVIKPYPMIEDGVAYIVLPWAGQSATPKAIQHRAPGIKFMKSSPSLSAFCPDMNHALGLMRTIIDAGIEISNLTEMRKQFKMIKRAPFRYEGDDNDMTVDR